MIACVRVSYGQDVSKWYVVDASDLGPMLMIDNRYFAVLYKQINSESNGYPEFWFTILDGVSIKGKHE